jgi:PAS domain S-box-containing protein
VQPDRPKLLVVDDNDIDRELVRRLLAQSFTVTEAATAREAIAACDGVDCVLLDHRLPDADGLDLLPELLARKLPVLMLTGQGNESIAVEAMKRGACDYLTKERLAREPLTRSITKALETSALKSRIDQQQSELRAHVAELARKTAELEASNSKLADRDASLRLVLEQMPAILWSADRSIRYTSVSGAGLRAVGLTSEELVGEEVGRIGGPDTRAHVEAQRRAVEGEPAQYDFMLRGRTFRGHVEPLRDPSGDVCGVVGVAIDLSETKRLELELRQAQKMDAIGKLAGGIAHDFNNILTVIKSFGAFVLEQVPSDHAIRPDMQEILGAADRAVTLVRQLLTFAKHQPVEPRVVSVADVLQAMLPMLRRLVGEDIDLRFVAPDGLWTTSIDPGGLEQVVVNLVVNARDAMPEGGAVTVQVANEAFDEAVDVGNKRFVARGEYVTISVTDEGTGIPTAIRDRIFEPFFTTKETGRGTGLGLSTCYGIVQQAGGVITVYSEEGVGSTFRIYLRRANEPTSAEREAPRVAPSGGHETILVVEDEKAVRAIVLRGLRRYGYDVLEATDVRDAVAIAEAHAGPIHLVLTDVVMPKMNGPAVVRAIRAHRPLVKVLYVSGYSDDAIRHRDLIETRAAMLAKPFTAESLARAVREVLDTRG